MDITLTLFLLTIASTHIKTVISEHTPCIILEGVCYRCINAKINGSEYDQKCTESRRTFAKFNSSNVLLSVITKCSGKAGTLHWIAARRFNEKKEFVWIADKTPVDSDYWAERFPIPTNGDCVGLDVKSKKLKNFRCHYKYPYICSYGAYSNIDEVSGESQSKPFHFYLQAFSIMGIIILIIGTGIYWRKGDELHKKPKSRKSVQHKPIRLSQGKHPNKINNILSTEHLESGPPSNTDFIITFPADADNAGPSNQEVYTSVDYEDGVLKVKAPDVITVTKKPVKRKGRIKSGFKKGLLSKGQKLKRLKATAKVEENVPAIVQEENPENFPDNVAEKVPENVQEKVPENVQEKVQVKVPENVPNKSQLNVQDKNLLKNPENFPNKVQLYSDTSQVKVVPENFPKKVPLNVPEKSLAKVPENVSNKSQLNIQEKAQVKVPENVPDKVPKDKSQIS